MPRRCASAWVEHSVSEETATAGSTRGGDATREQDAILSALGQPVYVSTPDGVISYLNPAAVTVLGFADATELIGQNGHWLVHYKRPDGTPFPIEDCPLARCRETGEPVSVENDWWVRNDGAMIPVACTAVPFEAPGGYGVVVSFTDLTTRRIAERAAHDLETARRQLKVAADEQAALRTVATLVAGGASQADVFAVVAREVAGCLNLPLVSVVRFDAGKTAAYVGLTALVINVVVAMVLTVAFRLARLPAGTDETAPAHYVADPDGSPRAMVPVTILPTETTSG